MTCLHPPCLLRLSGCPIPPDWVLSVLVALSFYVQVNAGYYVVQGHCPSSSERGDKLTAKLFSSKHQKEECRMGGSILSAFLSVLALGKCWEPEKSVNVKSACLLANCDRSASWGGKGYDSVHHHSYKAQRIWSPLPHRDVMGVKKFKLILLQDTATQKHYTCSSTCWTHTNTSKNACLKEVCIFPLESNPPCYSPIPYTYMNLLITDNST